VPPGGPPSAMHEWASVLAPMGKRKLRSHQHNDTARDRATGCTVLALEPHERKTKCPSSTHRWAPCHVPSRG
jgi:hypothetical protein